MKVLLFWSFALSHYNVLDLTARSCMAALTEHRLWGTDGAHHSVGGACRHLASSVLSPAAQSVLLCAQEALAVE